MRGRDWFWPLFCTGAGSAMVYLLRLGFGYWPSPVFTAATLTVAVGAGMVAARFSRLGPFEGLLGSPWAEARLLEDLRFDYERAMRYGRDLTIVLARQVAAPPAWDLVIRSVDRAITCRRNWVLLVLPETDPDGALTMVQRLRAAGCVSEAGIVYIPGEMRSADEIAPRLKAIARAAETRAAVATTAIEPAGASQTLI